jgi:CubicO group peptidase (beta-lactamase class C family)
MANPLKKESLRAAIDYIAFWIGFQLRASQQPGCVVAIAFKDKVLLDQAFGVADLSTGEKLTPRHRFRVASHSKSFTAAGVMKLREQGKLKLDDPIGDYVAKLNPGVARATIGQVLSHSAGITRDGRDSGQYDGRRPYLNAGEVMADLAADPVIEPNSRFKYSNHGFALLGLMIEAITGEPYAGWIKREIVDPAGLKETTPDMPIPKGTRFARGHSTKLLLGERTIFPGDYTENAITPAGGFVATASDLCRYFAQLSPRAERSILSVSSRREMTRRHWRNAHSAGEEYYGLGIVSGALILWPRHHQRRAQGLGLVRPQRRLAGLHLPHRRSPGTGPNDLRLDQRQQRLGGPVGRRVDPYSARILRTRPAHAPGARLDRALVGSRRPWRLYPSGEQGRCRRPSGMEPLPQCD